MDYGGEWGEWYWTDARQVMTLVQGSPIAIPIALGDVAPPGRNVIGFDSAEHLPVGEWWLSPRGHAGSLRGVKPGRYWLDVEVKWSGGSVTDYFILDLPGRNLKQEAELIHTVEKERY